MWRVAFKIVVLESSKPYIGSNMKVLHNKIRQLEMHLVLRMKKV